MPEALYTKDKKINLFPNEIAEDIQRVKEKLEAHSSNENEFLLIGRRQLFTIVQNIM